MPGAGVGEIDGAVVGDCEIVGEDERPVVDGGQQRFDGAVHRHPLEAQVGIGDDQGTVRGRLDAERPPPDPCELVNAACRIDAQDVTVLHGSVEKAVGSPAHVLGTRVPPELDRVRSCEPVIRRERVDQAAVLGGFPGNGVYRDRPQEQVE